jgi:tRNA nucleotidyltransferase (CCA-adding enzyme)
MDPTDPKRNVAASISPRSWIYCKYKVKEFLDTKNIELFFENNLKYLKNLNIRLMNRYIAEFKQINNDHYTKIRDKLYSLAENIKKLADMIKTNSSISKCRLCSLL